MSANIITAYAGTPIQIDTPTILRGFNAQEIAAVELRIKSGTIIPKPGEPAVGSLILTADLQELLPEWEGAPTQAGDVLLLSTTPGDNDLNGVVDGADVSLTNEGYEGTKLGWLYGDYDRDGEVTLADKAAQMAHFGT